LILLRSDALTNVSADTEWQDNKKILLGTDGDFWMEFDGSATYFKSVKHGAKFSLQGENDSGITKIMFEADPDIWAGLYYGGFRRIETKADGAKVTGKLELTDAGSKFYSPVGGEDSGGTWHPVTNPSTGFLGAKTSGWTADSFSGGWQVDFSSVVPAGTKAVRVSMYISAALGDLYWRKDGDANISNTPGASGEWSHRVQTNTNHTVVEVWLSAAYKAQFAVSNVNQDIYLAYPVEYMI